MENKHTRRGFTLIELLVVVLIIGILASVAVPQYQKAIEKTKASQAMMLLHTIYEAYEIYYLHNGSYPTSLEQLDIDVPTNTSNLTVGIAHDNNIDGVWVQPNSSNYSGVRFYIYNRYNSTKKMPLKTIICAEQNTIFLEKEGQYCKKIFKGTRIYGATYFTYYRFL